MGMTDVRRAENMIKMTPCRRDKQIGLFQIGEIFS